MFFPPGQVHMALVPIQQGVPRGLAGPLAGCGARKPGGLPGTALLPHPAAAGGARDMTNYIDLHTHSTESDGIYSPSELLHKAKEAGLRVLSLTDHDTTGGLEEAAQAARSLDI